MPRPHVALHSTFPCGRHFWNKVYVVPVQPVLDQETKASEHGLAHPSFLIESGLKRNLRDCAGPLNVLAHRHTGRSLPTWALHNRDTKMSPSLLICRVSPRLIWSKTSWTSGEHVSGNGTCLPANGSSSIRLYLLTEAWPLVAHAPVVLKWTAFWASWLVSSRRSTSPPP